MMSELSDVRQHRSGGRVVTAPTLDRAVAQLRYWVSSKTVRGITKNDGSLLLAEYDRRAERITNLETGLPEVTAEPTDDEMTPEQWVRHLAQGWGGKGGEKIAVLLAEFHWRGQEIKRLEVQRTAVLDLADEVERRASELIGVFSGKKGADVPHWVTRVRAALGEEKA